ncbi:hypothetical protein CORC01_11258 [Colletotrichum orchidophilum]|uniref:Uncharacterized protein n=1 Tax=Colletotrichum orchidophilum TaxID=1209926 RepID=A0A1G4AWL7_9PEZI|nr:uncharacterized protein CORC01_11258 [Colletotrichum orchidophilum]OHE93483.1 hypothetical protein CORC01_11258 [Colletotrichum orchidophilum]
MRDRVQLLPFVRRKPTLHTFKMLLEAMLFLGTTVPHGAIPSFIAGEITHGSAHLVSPISCLSTSQTSPVHLTAQTRTRISGENHELAYGMPWLSNLSLPVNQ